MKIRNATASLWRRSASTCRRYRIRPVLLSVKSLLSLITFWRGSSESKVAVMRFAGVLIGRALTISLCVLAFTPARAEGESEFLAGHTKACRGCSLEGVSLKRRDFSGADLSGATLSLAVLHRARLPRTTLTGANLKNANLNKTDLKNAVFS